MLVQSQPLDPKFCEKFGLDNEKDEEEYSEKEIKTQYIGDMFENLLNDSEKISLGLRLEWFWKDIKNKFYDLKYIIRNHFKWRKTINKLRPWEGFSGLISVMQTHLKDYLETEENYRKNKIATVKETLEILQRMENHDEYLDKHLDEVDSRYPDYKYLVTEYKNGGSCYSGDFVPQGNGWVGMESGKDPREGYFKFIDGKFQPIVPLISFTYIYMKNHFITIKFFI